MRRFVIGDIHGCAKALRTLIECIDPSPDDELIFLGDYVDRGPDSRGVIDQIIELKSRCRVVALRGNHEIMVCGVAFGGMDGTIWLESGGKATVTSYGGSLEKIPADHKAFFHSLLPHYETKDAIFVHACYDPNLPMEQQPEEMRYWTHIGLVPPPHCSGKRVYVGHTPQPAGLILDLGYLVCVDTYCFGTGYLTAVNVETDEVIQVDNKGFQRRIPGEAFRQWMAKVLQSIRAVLPTRKAKQSDESVAHEGALDDSGEPNQ